MRRLTAWIGGVAGGIAAYRFFRRHPQPEPSSPEPAESDHRAEELRAKLAESRTVEPVVEEAPHEPAPAEEPAAEPESPEERRRRVHEEGRAALEEMKDDETP
jgi:hypothetical protein